MSLDRADQPGSTEAPADLVSAPKKKRTSRAQSIRALVNAVCGCHGLPNWRCPNSPFYNQERTEGVAAKGQPSPIVRRLQPDSLEAPAGDFVRRVHDIEMRLDSQRAITLDDVRYLQARCAARLCLSHRPEDVLVALKELRVLIDLDLPERVNALISEKVSKRAERMKARENALERAREQAVADGELDELILPE